ncbi:molybdopterin converting factor subunit 1 [Gilvimarinus sp. 1_MG-2023]|uniref:molybdopterin converting factor subunit 1 n=1 Tax=Gilvimarinus sp. 1_MG-2023 TaxID=3062638 RepID=UPI0026E16FA6|nr:molybdopterin converting factor subunit 1 [Gilvimarinus sp. 1_MG-2023]MDO6747694.1 molybdopterin converting factor subunit 1 [Gilvimarinus sp. 1_MG-2023]
MVLTVLFFASLRERLGCNELSLTLPAGASVADVITTLAERESGWCEAFEQGQCLAAVNQQMVKPDYLLADGDELALFPPVTGG